MSYPVNIIEWESRFFGFPIGGVEIPADFSMERLGETLLQAKERFRLVTISMLGKGPEELPTPSSPSICYDRRVTLKKPVPQNVPPLDLHVKAYKSAFCTKWLERLAVQSATLTRFHRDAELSVQYERLYLTWINYAVSGELADSIWTWRENGKDIGLVTIRCAKRVHPETGEIEREGRIGMLAVDEEYRHRGIGHQLFEACDFWCSSLSVPTVTIITGKENTATISLCEHLGYRSTDEETIYHYWSPGWGYDTRRGWTRLGLTKKS